MPSNRTRLIAGNWKMNNDVPAAKELASALVEKVPADNGVEVVVCPPTIDLACTSHKIEGSAIKLGAQNVYWEASGAYTGETSCAMLKSVDAAYCIIGHSERRDYFHETDADENKKARALIAAGITPIFCCGESLETREAGEHVAFVTAQIRSGLDGVEIDSADQLVIAYEPIWAIGTGRTATPEQAEAVCAAIRATLAELFGGEAAEEMRVLYGGSMNPGNVEGLMAQPNIDGGLIGGASLKAASFVQLINACL